jgi:uncharacterized RDD family membrane protein YckC
VTDNSPGWYKDPVDQTVQRYWDGEGWIGDPIPADAPTPAEPPVVAPPPPPAGNVSFQPSPVPIAPPGLGSPPTGGWPAGSPFAGGPPYAAGPGGPAGPQPPVLLPPGVRLPPGAIPLPPGTPPPPGMFPGGKLPPGAIPVLLPGTPHPIVVPIVPAATAHGLRIAPMWSRLAARLIDIAVVLALNVVVNGWFAYQFWQEIAPQVRQAFHQSMAGQKVEPLTASSRLTYLQIVIILLTAALWFAYEVPAIAGRGQTFGKRLMRIKVMRQESGEPIGFGRAIRRWNPLGLSSLMWYCGIGFLLQFIDSVSPLFDWPLRRAFHDRAAGTVVVRLPHPTEDETPAPSGEPS